MRRGTRRALLYGSGLVLGGALLFAGFGITVPPDAGTRLSGAVVLANLGSFDEALKACDTVLEEHPDNLRARVYKATFLSMARRREEALQAYDDAIEHAARDAALRADLVVDRAALLLDAGRDAEFEHELDRLEKAGAAQRVLRLRGYAAGKRGAWQAAVDVYRKACSKEPDDAGLRARFWDALMKLGESRLAQGRLQQAEKAFDEAVPLFKKAGQAQLKAAEVRLALGDVDGALHRLRLAGPRTPGVAPLLFRAATLLLGAKGSEARAVEALQGAFAVDPEGTRALLESDPAWAAHRSDPGVARLLDSRRGKSGAGLTAAG